MKALCWHGKGDVRVERVPDPKILNPHDAILKITTTAICGSDLHLYDGYIPTMEPGDVLGHEFMGEVVETGPELKKLKRGDRVVVPFTVACGQCYYCKHDLWSACDNTNPNAWMMEKLYGYSGSGLFGYSHLMGGYAGGQAQFARVPFADVGCIQIPEGLNAPDVGKRNAGKLRLASGISAHQVGVTKKPGTGIPIQLLHHPGIWIGVVAGRPEIVFAVVTLPASNRERNDHPVASLQLL